MNSLLDIPRELDPNGPEFFETILTGEGKASDTVRHGGLLVERIISHGHATQEGEWYDQERDVRYKLRQATLCGINFMTEQTI